MYCSKSWELMMKKTDGDIPVADSLKLESHISGCGECQRQWELLQTAVRELKSCSIQAPPSIEKSVMSRLCSEKCKAGSGMLPYVVSPAAIICALLAVFTFNVFKAGPIPMLDKTAHALSFLMKALNAVASAAQYIMSVLHLSEVLIALPVILLVGVLFILYRSIRKMSDDQAYGRASK